MRTLIAEDDLASRKFLFKLLSQYGECDMTVDGLETVDAYLLALEENKPYDLICLDIMMPMIDGVTVLKTIRDFEKKKSAMNGQHVKVIMVTALAEAQYVQKAFEIGCDSYVSKPIDTKKLIEIIEKLELIDR